MIVFKPALSQTFVIRHRDPETAAHAREQRNDCPYAEEQFGRMVAAKRVGHGFRHQFVYSECSLDFVCRKLRLNVEVDGEDHTEEIDGPPRSVSL